jgi:glycosyltransferase involved in cell wall biosynthesis
MMTRAGWDVALYAGENNEAEVTEHVPLTTPGEQRTWYPDYEPKRDVFNDFDPNGIGWRTFNKRAVEAITERSGSGDVLCLTMGTAQREVADGLPHLLAVETGIGYSGVFAPYRVFESWAWRHYLASREPTDDVRFYDEVIPRAYEIEDFPAGDGAGEFALFIGRLTRRKGPHVAAMAAQRAEIPLKVAGQGVAEVSPGRIICTDGTELEGDVEYLGLLGPEERAEVMGKATAVLVPTLYLEPFGGVSVEAQMCGTPAVCSAWGGLTENVIHGETGFLCSTLAEFAEGISRAPSLGRMAISRHADGIWSTTAIAPRFAAYFDRLQSLFGQGWYAA